jgi:hypothetical protein
MCLNPFPRPAFFTKRTGSYSPVAGGKARGNTPMRRGRNTRATGLQIAWYTADPLFPLVSVIVSGHAGHDARRPAIILDPWSIIVSARLLPACRMGLAPFVPCAAPPLPLLGGEAAQSPHWPLLAPPARGMTGACGMRHLSNPTVLLLL